MLYIDITTTRGNRWRVPHGIPRVERELVRGFHQSGQPVTFVRVSMERGVFRAVPRGAVVDLLRDRPRRSRSLWPFQSVIPVHALGRFIERSFRRGRRWLLRAVAPPARRAPAPVGTKDDWFLHAGNNWRILDALDRSGFCGRLAFLVCDIIPLTHPGMFDTDFAGYMTEVAKRADIVFTISRYSRDTIIREFPVLDGRVVVVPLGFEHLARGMEEGMVRREANAAATSLPAGIPPDYLLSVGKLNARKNQAFLFDVLDRYARDHGDPPSLVLVGSPVAEVYPEFIRYKLDQRPWLRNKVILLDGTDDATLQKLYAGCRAFLFPSLVEGWGMPITEAVAAGKPVLAMAEGASEEAGLGFARLLRHDAGAWAGALAEVLEAPPSPSRRSEMMRAVASLSWDATVRAIADGLSTAPVRVPAPLPAAAPGAVTETRVVSAE